MHTVSPTTQYTVFNPGDVVMCIDDSFSALALQLQKLNLVDTHTNVIFPVKGTVYTVKEVRTVNGIEGIVLDQISSVTTTGQELTWHSTRFVCVDKSEIDKFLMAVLPPGYGPNPDCGGSGGTYN